MKKKESYYCAWCKREMHKAIVEGFHGICLECFKKYFPKEFSELTDKQRKKIGIAKNPESSSSFDQATRAMGLFRYYYVAYENVKPKELLARLLKDAWRANRHIEDALAFLSQGKKEKAERACRMAYGLLNEAIDAIHGG